MDNKPLLKRRCLNHVTHFKIWNPSHISGTAVARVVKFCTQVDCIKCLTYCDKLPLMDVVVVI